MFLILVLFCAVMIMLDIRTLLVCPVPGKGKLFRFGVIYFINALAVSLLFV